MSRYYDPETGRFINMDDINYVDPENINGLNLYAYCRNNPIMSCDPSGHELISILIGLGIAALIGTVVGAGVYATSEVLSYFTTGEWNWSWAMLVGSAFGGAIGGALAFAIPGLGIVGSAFVTGALSQGIGMGLQNTWEGKSHSFSEILVSSLLTGIVSAATAKLTSILKVPGFTGRGSISQVARQISTKFYNGTVRKITLRTFGKMVTYEAAYSVFNVIADVLINTYNHYKLPGSTWGD